MEFFGRQIASSYICECSWASLSITRPRLGIALPKWRPVTCIRVGPTWRRGHGTSRRWSETWSWLIGPRLAWSHSRLWGRGHSIISRLRSWGSVSMWRISARLVLLWRLSGQLLRLTRKARRWCLGSGLLAISLELLRLLGSSLLTIACWKCNINKIRMLFFCWWKIFQRISLYCYGSKIMRNLTNF